MCASPFDPLAHHDALCQDCRNKAPAFVAARAPWVYGGAARNAIHRFKYEGKSALAPRLACFLARSVREDDVLGKQPLDVVSFVPLHPRRQRRRGFNQSELLARSLSRELQLPFAALLERTRATPPQVELAFKERQQNVKGAFSVDRHAKTSLRGQHVLLVDDVFTTGATLRECALELSREGAASVSAVTLARQSRPELRPIFEPQSVFDGLIFD